MPSEHNEVVGALDYPRASSTSNIHLPMDRCFAGGTRPMAGGSWSRVHA